MALDCKNCGSSVTGNYCSHCGQSAKVDRITLSHFVSDIYSSVFLINKGFFYTLRELFLRPGPALSEFLEGKRKQHFKPVAYMFALSTIYFLISKLTDQATWIDDIISGFMLGAKDPEASPPSFLIWFADNFAYSTLLLLPVFSLASFIAYRKYKLHYLEHLVINSYITGQQAIFYLLFTLARMISSNDLLESLSLVVSVAYAFIVYWQLFSQGNRVKNILRSVLVYVLYLTFSLGLLFLFLALQDFQ